MNFLKHCAIVCTLSLFVFSLNGQKNADWTTELQGSAQSIVLHTLTGVPIVQTTKAYHGVDVVNKKIAWTMPRSSDKAASDIVEVGTDFFEVANSPFVVIRENLVESKTGAIVLNKEEEKYKSINSIEFIPKLNALLLETISDGKSKLYLVGLKDLKKLWGTELGKASTMSALGLGGAKSGEEANINLPVGTTFVCTDGTIVFKFRKNLVSINPSSGNIVWNEKIEDAGKMFQSPDGKILFVVEKAGGLSGVFNTHGKKITALDLGTGKPAWKKTLELDDNLSFYRTDPNQLLLVDKEGCNFYDYKTGEKVWKNKYEAGKITNVAEIPEGYEVQMGYFSKKMMKLDKEGKKMMKKPQRINATEEDDDNEDEGIVYNSGTVYSNASSVYFVPKKNSGKKKFSYSLDPEKSKVAFDEAKKNIILLHKGEFIVINPDKFDTGTRVFDLGKTETLENSTNLEIRDKGYFMSSEYEYFFGNPEENKVHFKYYKKPFDSKAFGLGLLKTAAGAYSAYSQVSGYTNAAKGAAGVTGSTLGFNPPGAGVSELNQAGNQFKNAQTIDEASSYIPDGRFKAFSSTRDYAYFFTTEKSEDSKLKVLIRVNKDSGEEKDKMILDNARPIYKVDEFEGKVYYVKDSVLKVYELSK